MKMSEPMEVTAFKPSTSYFIKFLNIYRNVECCSFAVPRMTHTIPRTHIGGGGWKGEVQSSSCLFRATAEKGKEKKKWNFLLKGA